MDVYVYLMTSNGWEREITGGWASFLSRLSSSLSFFFIARLYSSSPPFPNFTPTAIFDRLTDKRGFLRSLERSLDLLSAFFRDILSCPVSLHTGNLQCRVIRFRILPRIPLHYSRRLIAPRWQNTRNKKRRECENNFNNNFYFLWATLKNILHLYVILCYTKLQSHYQ